METAASIELQQEIIDIQMEINDIAKAEGFPPVTLTGKIYFCSVDSSIWHEVKDEYSTTSFISANYQHNAAHGETLVSADDERDIITYAEVDAR